MYNTKMIKKMKNEISLDYDFESLLSTLFGKEKNHGIVSAENNTSWAKHICRIFELIEKSINQNIVFSNNYQKSEISHVLSEVKVKISEKKSINSINQDTITGMSKIIFNLIGKMPDNWERKVINHPNHWRLDRYRTIYYSQTNRQKANLIMELAKHSDYNFGLPSKQELNHKFYREFKNDEVRFIDWFKKNYPENYIKMFLP